MRKEMKLVGLAIALACCFGSVGSAQADLITNGSFESPDVYFTEGVPAAGWTLIPGAASNCGGGIVSNGYPYLPPNAIDGTQAALLKSSGGMSQDVSGFDTAKQYTISFYAAGRDFGGTNSFQVLLDSTPLTFGSSTIVTPTVNEYTLYTSAAFVPTSSTMTLGFVSTLASNDATDLCSYVDVVRTSEVPEPAALALLATAMIGLLAYAWRKRR